MAGRSVLFVANHPKVLSGTIDIDAADKAARIIHSVMRSLSRSSIDATRASAGTNQEYNGSFVTEQKCLCISESTVPKVRVVIRNTMEGAIQPCAVMRQGGSVFCPASRQFALMGSSLREKPVSSEINGRKIRRNSQGENKGVLKYLLFTLFCLIKQYVDGVIQRETRKVIIEALLMLGSKITEQRS
jgi:acetyl-CoA carboxylase carboxyltransferase component